MIVLHILLLILEIIGIILLCVLALIILACFIPVGVTAEYSRDGVLVLVHAGPVKIQLLPKKEKPDYKVMVCDGCGYEYDPMKGDPEADIAPGTPFDQLPEDWVCPKCAEPKKHFYEA